MFEEENEVIQFTSKGAREIGLMFIKDVIKELELTKRRFLSLKALVARLDQEEADRILLFATKEGINPIISPIRQTLLSLNDGFLEPLREALIQKKIKTWQEAVALFESPKEDKNHIQNFISNINTV